LEFVNFLRRLVIQPVVLLADCLISTFWVPGCIFSHHGSSVPSVKCPYCTRIFVNKSNLRIHIRDVHSTDRGPFSCVQCGKQVKNRSCLRVHMYRSHTLWMRQGLWINRFWSSVVAWITHLVFVMYASHFYVLYAWHAKSSYKWEGYDHHSIVCIFHITITILGLTDYSMVVQST
jgi:hypothetical protein